MMIGSRLSVAISVEFAFLLYHSLHDKGKYAQDSKVSDVVKAIVRRGQGNACKAWSS